MRSSSGPDSRRWWRARSAAVQRHASSPIPHGHGLEAATSMNRVGNATTCCERTIVTCPSSSGWRSASRLERTNSDSSSRNRTPWCASVASPGSGCEPPPTRPDEEIVWWGARNGRWRTSPSPSWRPATEWMRVTSTASAAVIGGRIEGSRRASIVLPVPGGPCMNRLWPPAAATSRPGMSAFWPRTSARSSIGSGSTSAGGSGTGAGSARPASTSTASVSDSMPTTVTPGTSAASRARDRGTSSRSSRWRRVPSAIASAPRMARTSPVSDSSPTIAVPSTASDSTWSEATRMAIASGRSNPGPILRR